MLLVKSHLKKKPYLAYIAFIYSERGESCDAVFLSRIVFCVPE